MSTDKVIRVGSRKSELALIQTKHVISRLQKLYPNKKFEIHTMSTIGDRVLNVSLPKIGEKSLFTRDLEDALRNGGVDFVVHSLKDLPTALPPGMAIGAILEREDSRDALVLNAKFKGKTIDTLPKGCIIGTSSLRRTAQLRRLYPDLEICDIRGNLNTRLAKLDADTTKYAGVILAQAGLVRMGWNHRISQILEPTHILYAVGQGALAVECRSNDEQILTMLQMLMCLPTACRIIAERSFLKTLGGGCSAPVAVVSKLNGILSDLEKNKGACLQLTGAVWSLDGTLQIDDKLDCSLDLNNCDTIDNNCNTDDFSDSHDNDVSPTKRKKYDESDRKQGSPTVINDDLLAGGDATNITDIQFLIDIHGELFKKCPFYSKHHHERDTNGNNSTVVDECPLKIPVGQDFMGKCPYVDTDQKVNQSLNCPITGITKNVIENSEIENGKNSTKLVLGATTSKCPFTGSSSSKLCDAKKVIGAEACPFIQKTVKMIDYGDEEKPIATEVLPILIDDSHELFCGLYRHRCYNHDLFAKCEDLGRDLANNLIGKGALDVMKCAQNEIHAKVQN